MSGWEDVRAIMLERGDVTPAGPVEDIDSYGEMHIVVLTIGGTDYTRSFDDLVSRERPHKCPNYSIGIPPRCPACGAPTTPERAS